MSRRSKLILGALGAIGIVALAAAAGYAAHRYREAASEGPNGTALLLDPEVMITTPAADSTFEAGQELSIEVTSTGHPFAIASLQLYVDQILAETSAASPSGASPYSSEFTLALADAGSHFLVARVTDVRGFQGVSVPVRIEIVKNTTGETAPFFSEAAGPIVLGSGDPVALPPEVPSVPPNPDAPTAKPWRLSPIQWIFGSKDTQPLEPADLESNYQRCAVHLSIWDHTDHENGYAVFRSIADMPGWHKIADLAPVWDAPWTFDDEDLPDTNTDVSYYVEAFNDADSAKSNVETIHLSPDPDCLDTYDGPAGFSLDMGHLTVDLPVDSAYCYRSFDGVSWHRWPASGFFEPDPEGQIDTGEGPLVFFTEDLDGNQLNLDPSLSLDCWGWRGGELIALGDFTGSKIDPTKASIVDFRAGRIKAELGTNPTLSQMRPDFDIATLPFYSVRVAYWPHDCQAHLAGGQDPAIYCSPLNGFNQGPDGLAPQPYLVWDMQDDKCLAGSGPLHCIPWDAWLQEYETWVKSGGTKLIWNIYDSDKPNGGFGTESPYQRVIRIDPTMGDCILNRSFTVQLTVELLGDRFTGPNSSTFAPCDEFQALSESMNLEIEYGLLSLSDARDGFNNHHLEVYGNLEVFSDQAPYNGGIRLAYPDGDYQTIKFLSIDYQYQPGGGGDQFDYRPGRTVSLWNGDYFFSDIPFAEWTPDLKSVLRATAQGNNKVVVQVHDNEHFRIHVGLLDDDGQWLNPDPVCITEIKFGGMTLPELATEDIYRFQAHMSRGQDGNASCDVQIFIRPIVK